MRFDWYEPTLLGVRPDAVVDFVKELLGECKEERIRPKRGYERAVKLEREDEVSAQVWWAGRNIHPHCVFTSEFADQAAHAVRSEWPLHQVSRADVCEDIDAGPQTWDVLSSKLLKSADEHGVAVRHVGDFHRAAEGRSLYEGAVSSEIRVRLYEKGKEVQARYPLEYRGILKRAGWTDTLCRLEFQCRPSSKSGKLRLASLQAQECVGFAAWSRGLWAAVGGADMPRLPKNDRWKPNDDDRVFYAMLRQYGRLLRSLRAQLGGWDCVGRQIGDALSNAD